MRASRTISLERKLFIGCGMVGWMDACSSFSASGDTQHKGVGEAMGPGAAPSERIQSLPAPLHAEVTEILAGIAWTVLRR